MAGRDTVENVDVTLTATDKASKPIDAVAGRLEGLDDVDVALTADDKASKPIANVEDAAKELDRVDPTVELDMPNADRLKRDIHAILEQAQDLDRADVTVDVDVKGAKQAGDDLDHVAQGAHDAGRESLTSVDPLRDVSGALGDIGGTGLDAADGILGVSEVLPALIPQLEGFAGTLGAAGIAVGVGSVLVAGLTALPDLLGGVSDKEKIAKDATEKLTTAFLDQGVTVEALNDQLTTYLKGNPDVVAAMNTLGVSAAGFRDVMVGGTNPAIDKARRFLNDYNAAMAEVAAANAQGKVSTRDYAAELGLTQQQLNDLVAASQTLIDAVDGQSQGYQAATATAGAYQHAIDGLAQDRHGSVTVDVSADTKPAEQDLADWIHDVQRRQVTIDVRGNVHVGGAGAMAGTPYWQGGPLRVGEAGPETVWLPRGSRVDTAGRTAAADRAAAGAVTVTYYVNVVVPVGTPGPEVGRYVADALDAHERRTGSRRRAVA